jgi:hypothetical protein
MIDSSKDNGRQDSPTGFLSDNVRGASYSIDANDVRSVEIEREETEDAAVEVLEADEAVETSELVLESSLIGESLSEECCRLQGHLRDFWEEASLAGSGLS